MIDDLKIGDFVYWYPDGDEHQEPHPAIVTHVAHETICVNVFDRATMNMRIRDGVRKMSDPKAKQVEFKEQGAWTHAPQRLEIDDLKKRVCELEDILLAKAA